jgi:cytochrome P450
MSVESSQLDYFGQPAAAHVPPELFRYVDLYDGPGLDHDPYAVFRRLREEPAMIYNLRNPLKGQAWIPTRAADIRYIVSNTELFSSTGQLSFSSLIGESWKMGLIEMDPPEHTKYRRMMNPWLSPGAVGKMSDRVRARAIELIEKLRPAGRCEFMSEFGTPYPISIFMEMMGLPASHTTDFLRWTHQMLHTGELSVKADGARSIATYLRELFAQRRRAPRDDLATKIVTGMVDDRPLNDDEIIGIGYLIFLGGLDTVASALGFFFRHLANHPELQQRLRDRPDDIPQAVEEYLRAYSPTQLLRRATRDTEVAGVKVKKGDWLTLVLALGSTDPREFPNPDTVDFDRVNNRHLAFAFGPHFCLGSHLARRELQIALEEWARRVPLFHLDPQETPKTHGGQVFGIDRLVLEW